MHTIESMADKAAIHPAALAELQLAFARIDGPVGETWMRANEDVFPLDMAKQAMIGEVYEVVEMDEAAGIDTVGPALSPLEMLLNHARLIRQAASLACAYAEIDDIMVGPQVRLHEPIVLAEQKRTLRLVS